MFVTKIKKSRNVLTCTSVHHLQYDYHIHIHTYSEKPNEFFFIFA